MKGQAVLLTAAGIGLTLVCFLGASWFGPAGAMLQLLTPVFACYLAMRFGMPAGVVTVAVVSLLLGQSVSLQSLIAYLALFGASSLLLPLLLRRQLAWDRAVLATLLAGAAITVLLAALLLLSSSQESGALLDGYLQSEIDLAMQAYRDAGLDETQVQELSEVVAQVADFIRSTFVGLYLAGSLVIQLLCLLLLHRLQGEHYSIAGTPFVRWRLPAALIWALIASGFALLAPWPQASLIGRNLLALLLPLYFLQGLAVVASLLQRKAYPPVLKGMIYLMVFILSPLPMIITGVGVFDLWIDFRRPRKKDI